MFNVILETEPMPVNAVKILIYGEIGIGKTSIASTANRALLFDFDEGAHRSMFRKNVVPVKDWGLDIQNNIGDLGALLEDYDTIILDTVDTCLEILGAYLVKQNYKLKSDGRLYYGALKTEFSQFVNLLLSFGKDVIFIAHSKEKETKEVAAVKPDITGGSYGKITKKVDFIGYVFSRNNKAVISFDPTDSMVGKNSAFLPTLEVPNFKDEPQYFAKIIANIKETLNGMSAAQAEAMALVKQYREEIEKAITVDEINAIAAKIQASQLNKAVREQIIVTFKSRFKHLGFEYNKETKLYYDPKPKVESKENIEVSDFEEPETEPISHERMEEPEIDDLSDKVEALKREMIEAEVEV